MRILELGKYFPPYAGGVEVVTELSARALAKTHEVIVICHNTKAITVQEKMGDYLVIRCATQATIMKQPISLTMGFEIRKFKPDLIHFHAPNFWAAAMITLYASKIPIIITHHADVEGRILARALLIPLYKAIARRAARIIVASLKTARDSTDLNRDNHSVAEIPLGVDQKKLELTASEVEAAVAEKERRFGDGVLFCFVGRLVWYKGLPVLFSAMSKVQGARLMIIGDGPMKAELQALADSLGIRERIQFMGRVDEAEKKRWLHAMDALVLPSTHKTEAFGLVQVEAQLCAKPVISTDLPTGVSDVTVDGVTGFIVKAGDAESLAEKMQCLVDQEPLRAQMGAAGARRAMLNYTETHYMSRLCDEVSVVVDALQSARTDYSERPA